MGSGWDWGEAKRNFEDRGVPKQEFGNEDREDGSAPKREFGNEVNVTTGSNGQGHFLAELTGLPPTEFLSATATDPNNNTSEFGSDFPS